VILTYTTSPILLTDGLERLLSPLKAIKVPVHEFAMMMTIALRFIPTLIEETDKIMSAQKARGADFSSGGLIKRAKALIPVLIPLFISAFRRAGDLAVAMECRCYRGGNGRTRMTKPTFGVGDAVLLLLIVCLGVGILVINRYIPYLSM
jgi:energy-coupling factor transport system permease protein